MATLTTELQAVNTILSAVGEPPINSLDDANPADAVIAQNILTEISREIQMMGWHFNTVREVLLAPITSESNKINVGTNVVRVDLEPEHTKKYDIVQRGSFLYDRKGQTSSFNESLKATVVYILSWDELPEPARRLITTRSARVFQARMVGSGDHYSFTMQDELNAMAVLKEFEGDTAGHSIFDHYDVYRAIDRDSVSDRIGR